MEDAHDDRHPLTVVVSLVGAVVTALGGMGGLVAWELRRIDAQLP
jgi:hypothetical protein